MFIEKLNTAWYAYKKHLQGYELLKNPKDVSSDEVNLLKTSYSMNATYDDDIYQYIRIRRKKVNGNYIEITKNLRVTRLMNPKTKKITNQKDVFYHVQKNGQYVSGAEKYALTEEDRKTRKALKWKLETSVKNAQERFNKERQKAYFQPHISFLEKILTLGNVSFFRSLSGIPADKPIKPSFTRLLLENLKLLKR